MAEERKYHTGLRRGDVGGYVLLPGDPGRTELIAKHLEGAQEVAFNREYRTFTGRLGDVPVSTCSTGIGGPSTAIAVEELSELGVHTFIRVGTAGALQAGIGIGDLIIATAAVRSEGTPNAYVPPEYPAVADHAVVAALRDSARSAGVRTHTGFVRSVDALYADTTPRDLPRGPSLVAELDMWSRAGVLASDMESSTLFVLCSLKGLRAGTVLLCVDAVGEGDIQPVRPEQLDAMLAVAVGAVRGLVRSG